MDALRQLSAKGATLDYQDDYGKTPLMHAISFDQPEMVEWLLDHGVDPHVKSAKGLNALQMAQRPDSKAAFALEARLKQQGIMLQGDFSDIVLDQFRLAKAKFEKREAKKFSVSWESNATFEHLPDAIGDFDGVQRFSIHNGHNLLDLPDAISHWHKLEEFEFVNMAKFQVLNSNIGSWKGLRSLKLNWCWKLESIPESISELSQLQHLQIVHGKIRRLPAGLSKLTQLTHVTINGLPLEEVPDLSASQGIKVLALCEVGLKGPLPAWILKLPHLTELSISNNELTHIPKEILKLPLKKFNFQKNPLLDPPIKQIKGGFKGLVEWWSEK